MGFGAEMKDFLSAAETGVRIKLNSQNRKKVAYDMGEKPGFDPNSPSTLAGGGGAAGGVGTTTAPQVAGSGGDKTASTTKGGTNAFGKQAYDFYRGKGLSHAHAAGIVGNLMGESGGDPNVLNGVRAGDSGHSWYAGQWNGKRLDNLLAFAKQQHPDSPQPTTTDQLGFVLEESNSKSPYFDAGAGKAFQLASQAQTVDQATDAYMTHYERPRDRSSFKRRVEYASGFVDDGSGGDGAAPAAETPEANKAGPPAPTADSGGDDGSGDSGMLQPQVDIIEPPAEQDVEAPQVETDPALFGTGLYAQGGAIPDDAQYFAEGGVPATYNPDNPSAVNGLDKYNTDRAYTQPIAQTQPASSTVPRRISFPNSGQTPDWRSWGAGSPSQLKFRTPAPAAAAPAAAPAAAAPVAAPKPAATNKSPWNVPMSVVMPYGNKGGAFGYYDPTLGQRMSQGQQKFAKGGAIPDDRRFNELMRQEHRQHPDSFGDHGGESYRDRAARRLSAEQGRPSSTAYSRGRGGGRGGGGANRFPPAPSLQAPHPSPAPRPEDTTSSVATPIAEDRATRFRRADLPAEEDRATRFRPPQGPQQGPPAPQMGPQSAKQILDTVAENLPFKQKLDKLGQYIWENWYAQPPPAADPNEPPPTPQVDPMGNVTQYARGGAIPDDDRFAGRNVGRSAESGATFRGPKRTKTSTKQRPRSTDKVQQRRAGKKGKGKRRSQRPGVPTPSPRPDPNETSTVPTPSPRPLVEGYDPRGTPDPVSQIPTPTPRPQNYDPRGTPDPVPQPVGPGGTPTRQLEQAGRPGVPAPNTFRGPTLGGTPTRQLERADRPGMVSDNIPNPARGAAGYPSPSPYEQGPPPRPAGTYTYGYEPSSVRDPQPHVSPGGGVDRWVNPMFTHKAEEAQHYDRESAAARERQRLRGIGGAVRENTSAQPAVPQDSPGIVLGVPTNYDDPNEDPYSNPSMYARGGAIPDPSDPTVAEGAGYIPSAGGDVASRLPAQDQGNEQVALSDNPHPSEVMRGATNAVGVGLQGLQRIFGISSTSGAVPTPEDDVRQQDGARRMASGQGAATAQEVQAIDKSMGLENMPVDEGMKNLIRIDQTVQYYLQRGDKDKAEAVAASLLQFGARRVAQYGTVAQAAFEDWQQTGDPQSLKNASRAIQMAHQLIPDGWNVKIDVDPQSRQIVSTMLGPDGQKVQKVVDPMAIPGMLRATMDGSDYWSSVFQVGQPDLAKSNATQAAASARAQEGRQYNADQEQKRWERNQQAGLEKEGRTAKRKLWEYENLGTGQTAGERANKENQAYFDEWQQKLAAATPEEQQQLTAEGMGYAYEHAAPRKTPLDDETLSFGTDTSAFNDTFEQTDLNGVRTIARSIAQKNNINGPAAMEAAASLIMDPAPQIDPNDGTLDWNGISLVFNPQLLPVLGTLHKKYGTQQ